MAAAERRTRPPAKAAAAKAASAATAAAKRKRPSPRPARPLTEPPAPLALAIAGDKQRRRERIDRWVREWGGDLFRVAIVREGQTESDFRRALWRLDAGDVREATYRLMTDHVRPWRVAKAMVPWAAVADLVAVMRERGLAREVEKGWADAEIEWESERLS